MDPTPILDRDSAMKFLLPALALAAAIALAPGDAAAHSFRVALVAPFDGPKASEGAALAAGFLIATRERDGHPDETSDGHLGGLDVHLVRVNAGQSDADVLAAAGALLDGDDGEPVAFLAVAAGPKLTAALEALSARTRAVFIDLSAGPLPDPGPPEAPGDGTPAAAPFAEAFRATHGGAPDAAARTGYRAARLIDRAVRAQAGVEDRAALLAAVAAAGAR